VVGSRSGPRVGRLGWICTVLATAVGCAADAPDGPSSTEGAPGSGEPLSASVASIVETDPAVLTGQELFGRIGCNGCHTIDGVGGIVGPNLTGVGARPSRDPARWLTTEAYIRASIQGPEQFVVEGYTPDMPAPELLGVTGEDIDHLVQYLLSRQTG